MTRIAVDNSRSSFEHGAWAATDRTAILITWLWIEWNSINSDAALRLLIARELTGSKSRRGGTVVGRRFGSARATGVEV